MNTDRRNTALCILVLGLLISGCGPARIVPIVPLATSGNHTCALISSGEVKCWGYNRFGQLGGSPYPRELTPVNVLGLTGRISAITIGGFHSCALNLDGDVKCWGDNDRGQLGDGTNLSRRIPADVIGLSSGVVAISAGDEYTCALTSGGGVKCWGDNDFGFLGDGTATNRLTPVDVIGLTSGVIAISAGYSHTCAVTSGGGVKCWGYGGEGQLGDGSEDMQLTPVDVIGLTSGASTVAVGMSHTCVLISGGGVKCWGMLPGGGMINGLYTIHLTPVDVTGLTSGVVAISAGLDLTCALTSGGGVKCWDSSSPLPVDIKGLTSGVVAISAGWDHNCALMSSGAVKCWGSNLWGVLGDGTTIPRLTPVDVQWIAVTQG